MPTITDLAPAIAAADTDEFMVNQGGTTRKVTRAMVLSGVQPQLALSPGTVLGRAGAGIGGPEALSIGANLTVSNGCLSATAAPFEIAALPSGIAPSAGDRVALSQGGSNVSLSYPQFMAGLSALSDIDASGLLAVAEGTTEPRTLADLLSDSITVESFGAKGDGQTDDSAAFSAAIASGRPVRLGAKIYAINGPWKITATASLLGCPGQTIIRRLAQVGNDAWISIGGPSFRAVGVTFDANGALVQRNGNGLVISPECTQSDFQNCVFSNAIGASGHGLYISAPAATSGRHTVQFCEARDNAGDGIRVQTAAGIQISSSKSHGNGGSGILVENGKCDGTSSASPGQVQFNTCWQNTCGIAIGLAPSAGQVASSKESSTASPSVCVVGNICHDNAAHGIRVNGSRAVVHENFLASNGSLSNKGCGILVLASHAVISGNAIANCGKFGINSGGSVDCSLTDNRISQCPVGINPGGSQRVQVSGNSVQDCGWGIVVQNVEVDENGWSYGLAVQDLSVTNNWIAFKTSSGGGVFLVDAPEGIVVARNTFSTSGSANVDQCLWAHTDSAVVRDNIWNGTQSFVCNPGASGAAQEIRFPDIADRIMVTYAPDGVRSMRSLHQAAMLGQVTYIKVTNGGAGYTNATVSIQGSGSGATAVAYLSGGQVVGITMTNGGSGYGASEDTVPVVITGDGTGATAMASVGLPVLEGRRLAISCNCTVGFARNGSTPLQENWTGTDMTIPANSTVEWVGAWGTWRAVQFSSSDYILPIENGGVLLKTFADADLVVRPSGHGRLRIGSDADPTGYCTCVGHGSPEGQVTAPPGSDFRNLDGGIGRTFWIKQSGTGATGWIAVA